MDELRTDMTEKSTASGSDVRTTAETGDRSRRDFLHGSARKLAYAAPLILLFHPRPACASGGSQLTTP